jgi:hypothetical protein
MTLEGVGDEICWTLELVVVIGVKEGYREAGLEAMRMDCAEVVGAVENLWKDDFPAVFRGF